MTRSGTEYIAGLRDGRRVCVNGEWVSDVTIHPAFKGAVQSIAELYDIANDPNNRELMTFASPKTGEPVNRVYQIPHSQEDLRLRRKAIKRWSESTFGFMGRSPDHVGSFLTAFASTPQVFARGGEQYAQNLLNFYEEVRDNDLYVSYVIVPPQIDRSKPAHQQEDPHLYAGVKEERPDGIVIKGAQMLGTGAAASDYLYLSCIHPMKPGDENYAIAVAIPISTKGVKIYSRRSYAEAATSMFDYPMAARFDEMDALMVFDDVFVPWGKVFIYRNLDVVKAQWWETPAHVLGNNQAQIRYSTKLQLLVGLAKKVAEMNGTDMIPPVQGALGEMAAYAAMVEGLVLAQEEHCLVDEKGIAWPGVQELYSNMMFQPRVYDKMLELVRDLCGGGLIQLPSSNLEFQDPEMAADLAKYVRSPGYDSVERTKLLKLVWDCIGSEFAGRHHQYEMFYAGAPFLIKGHMYRNYNFKYAKSLAESALSGYDLNGRKATESQKDLMTTS